MYRPQRPRRFQLHRHRDHSGVSGVGIVADGVEFPDGTAAIRWRGPHASTVIWATTSDIETVHGHDGDTELTWID